MTTAADTARLRQLFEHHFGQPPEEITPVQGGLGGSGRRILRMSGADASAIGILYEVRAENEAFLGFTRHFREYGLPVPAIYAADLDAGAYIEEDLGDTTLFSFLSENRQGPTLAPEVYDAYREAIAWLPSFQVLAGPSVPYELCSPRAEFDAQSIAWDLNYFKYYYLKLAGIAFNEQRLEDDFAALTAFLLTARRDFFLYRDFQSRNIMLLNGRPYFLDYQGGRRGALHYDIASLLFDGKADLPPDFREQMLDAYLDALGHFLDVDREEFLRHFYGFVYVRILQAMGAYGYRGFYERKPHFLASVPYALRNLRWLAENVELPVNLPELMRCLRAAAENPPAALLSASEPDRSVSPPAAKAAGLTVRIMSFSYKRGLPQDASGHGGGFIFDARAVPNPGREDRYKPLTGRDADVVAYIEAHPAAHEFLAHTSALVEASVREYLRRGFDHLSVAFGCTGGQHRSVYFAERMAERLRVHDGVHVTLEHRELTRMGLL